MFNIHEVMNVFRFGLVDVFLALFDWLSKLALGIQLCTSTLLILTFKST